jgi:ribosomal protein S12 methylthiotransferase accessory factor
VLEGRELAAAAAGLVTEQVEPAAAAETVSTRRSAVVRVMGASGRAYAVKLWTRSSDETGTSFEALAYSLLATAPCVRRLRASGDGYLITDWVDGEPLANLVHSETCPHGAVAEQLLQYLDACRAVDVVGFGKPDRRLRGPSESWSAHLAQHLGELEHRASRLEPSASRSLTQGLSALRTHWDLVERRSLGLQPALAPVDLNMTNLLFGSRLVALDLKTFWLADPLFALGEWAAHTYGTQLYTAAVARWQGGLTREELLMVRLYALLAIRDIQVFLAELNEDFEGAVPWGNDVPFARLSRQHEETLASADPTAEEICLANPELLECAVAKAPGGARREDLAVTSQRLESVRALAGVTRVAEITGLDRTGLHVYQATRPDAEIASNTFTVFSGRGGDPQQSRVGAIAEAIERHCGERRHYPPERLVRGAARELRDHRGVVDLDRFNLPGDVGYMGRKPMEWVPATSLTSGLEHLVPACTVFYPYEPPAGCVAPLRYFTTGFGAASMLDEAIAHGLNEVTERDAAALNRILRDRPAVDLESIDDEAVRVELEHLTEAGLSVVVRWITAPDLGIPAFNVLCEDPQDRDALYVSGGYGCHPDKSVALTRAIQECAASRVGTISGAREDLDKFKCRSEDYQRYRRRYAYWFDVGETVDYATLPSLQRPTNMDDIAAVVGAFGRLGFDSLVVDLTRPELQLRVVKVLVPGVERYSFRMSCIGRRARTMYHERWGKPLAVSDLYRAQDAPSGARRTGAAQ